MHTYNVLFCEQLGHIPFIFQQYYYDIIIQHKLNMYTPCVAALFLSDARTALCQAALNIINLDLLLVT